MQSIPVQPGLLWKPLDTLHWMEPMSEALQRYFRDRPRYGSDSSIYLGGTNIWNGPKNKKKPGTFTVCRTKLELLLRWLASSADLPGSRAQKPGQAASVLPGGQRTRVLRKQLSILSSPPAHQTGLS